MTYEKQGLFVDEAHLEHYAENLARGWKLTGEMCGRDGAVTVDGRPCGPDGVAL